MITIVGAGPSGLTASILLSQHKIPHRVFERRATESGHPRATVLNVRSMEIMRQFGIAETLRQQSLASYMMMYMRWFKNLATPELARYDLSDKAVALIERINHSTEVACVIPQDLIEPILLQKAKDSPYAQIHLGAEVLSTRQDTNAVYNTVRYQNGEMEEIKSSYLLAADGANSNIRQNLGIPMLGEPGEQWVLNIHFRADFSGLVKRNPAILYWIVGTKANGMMITLNGSNRWLFNQFLKPGESEQDYTPERIREVLRAMSGDPKLEPEIVHRGAWLARAEVAQHYRSGRVFLVGDSAHRFPPTGGLGMNSGIQDAHNLVWKLVMVMQNQAKDELLDTYELERRPVGVSNAKLSWHNFQLLPTSGIGNNQLAAQLEQDANTFKLAKTAIKEAMHLQSAHFDYPGQEIGFIYQSSATVSDGLPLPDSSNIARYTPSTTPGARAPHIWVKHKNTIVSSLDLLQGWTLFAAKDANNWVSAAQVVANNLGIELRVLQDQHDFFDTTAQEQMQIRKQAAKRRLSTHTQLRVGIKAMIQQGFHKSVSVIATPLSQAYSIGTTGAVLVRPDGHVAWRSQAGSPNPTQTLLEVFAGILQLKPAMIVPPVAQTQHLGIH
jgi:putative polyketide hydroxylase